MEEVVSGGERARAGGAVRNEDGGVCAGDGTDMIVAWSFSHTQKARGVLREP